MPSTYASTPSTSSLDYYQSIDYFTADISPITIMDSMWQNISMTFKNDTGAKGPNLNCSEFPALYKTFSDTFHQFPPYYRPLVLFMYIIVACIGAFGNSLVIAAVLRNPQMRIPRNYFIINLALSDFLMCSITVPFTMVIISNTFWSLGELTCKFVSTSQGINLFVSSMSITAIGFDRYWVILFPTKTNQQRVIITICFLAIWTLSFVFALPMFSATQLFADRVCDHDLIVCVEKWQDMPFTQSVYALGCIIFQYLLPITMLTFLYGRIMWRLKGRASRLGGAARGNSQLDDGGRRRSVETRQRRMNILLVCIVLTFATFWLPLNIHNTLVSYDFIKYTVPNFAFCHIVGITSSCINPILYGVLNDNFRNEFIIIFTKLKILPAYRSARQCCRKTLGGGASGTLAANRRRSTNARGVSQNNTAVTVDNNTAAAIIVHAKKPSSNNTVKFQEKPKLIVNNDDNDNDFQSINDNVNQTLTDENKIDIDDVTTALLLTPNSTIITADDSPTGNNDSSCYSNGSSNHLETATLLGNHVAAADSPPEIDTTVVSADTLPLCRRNLIANGLHAKSYLLKTDLV